MGRSEGAGRPSAFGGRVTDLGFAATAIVLGPLCALALSIVVPGPPGSPAWLVAVPIPIGLAGATVIGTVARRRWGYVAARWLGAYVAVFCGAGCLLLVAGGLVMTIVDGGSQGDAAPPAWVLAILGLVPGAVAAAAFGLHRASAARLRAWDSP